VIKVTGFGPLNYAKEPVNLLDVIKVTGFGVLNYAKEPFNLLDAFIVTTSMLELPAAPPAGS
ncbi:hypothetical protein T484DRAFT_1848094, partial [Baffinella frigidus]